MITRACSRKNTYVFVQMRANVVDVGAIFARVCSTSGPIAVSPASESRSAPGNGVATPVHRSTTLSYPVER